MFFDFPDDKECYSLGEQYMFGDDILFAPIVNRGQTKKTVYLPVSDRESTCLKGRVRFCI
jgi:alpha-D-xyloside xylohydrolase